MLRHESPSATHRIVLTPSRAGPAVADFVAAAAYDLVRLVLVRMVDISFWPFDVLSRFGRLLVGSSAPMSVVDAAGVVHHSVHGCGFALAIVLFVDRPTMAKALVGAGLLQLFMLSLSPGWLRLPAHGELLSVAAVGHLAYAVTLTVTTRQLLRSENR